MGLGEILSFVLEYMNTSLTQLEDIAADESTFLITLYTSLFSLSALFDPLDPGPLCPEWLKSQYIRELLEWRMVDIMDSYREGLLQGSFTKEELVGWLRKLFQDSEIRARNITEILRG
jgi:ZW10 C-terminal helical domain